MLSQLMWLFGFFALVLVAVFWINRAVQLFDRLIGDGQSALVFLEFSALGLPRLVMTVLPIATFAATVYVTNRLNNESELTVMLSTGTSPWRLALPVVVFGGISAMMMTALSHILVPIATEQLSQREAEIARNATSQSLTEGTFLSPVTGVTFYTRAIRDDGLLEDVFLADRRDPAARIIYTATEAYLVRDEESISLIMVDGLSQRLATASNSLTTGKFQDFTFDISALVGGDTIVAPSLQHVTTDVLLWDWAKIAAAYNASPGAVAEEMHSRIARGAFCVVTALIGFAILLVGGYSRFGAWREVVISFLLLITLDGMRSALSPPVLADARLWPILYLPSALGIAISAVLLWYIAGGSGILRPTKGQTS